MKKWLFTPFEYVAGSKALLIGVAVMAATAIIGYYSETHFDGVLDTHTGAITPIAYYFIEQLVNWACLTLLFFTAGKLFSRSSIRLVDVAGTMALARWPGYIAAIAGFGLDVPVTNIPERILQSLTPPMIACLLVTMACTILMVALYYNAWRISCNMKDGKGVGIFIVTLILAEVASKLLLMQVYK